MGRITQCMQSRKFAGNGPALAESAKSVQLSKIAGDRFRRFIPSLETDTILDLAYSKDHCMITGRMYVTGVHRICDEKVKGVASESYLAGTTGSEELANPKGTS